MSVHTTLTLINEACHLNNMPSNLDTRSIATSIIQNNNNEKTLRKNYVNNIASKYFGQRRLKA